MNKEEILKQLTELQARLDSEVDGYDIENRVEEIENITSKISRNNTIIKYYAEQLADDKNFMDETPIQYYLMLEAQELANLKSKQAAERENQDKILSEDSIIASSVATISVGQEEIAKLGVDNIQLSIDIRRARLSSNTTKIEACENKIVSNNERIQELQTQIGSIETDIEKHNVTIESLNVLTDSLKEQTNEAQVKYDTVIAKENSSKTGEIDLAKRNKAEADLDTLIAVTSTLEQRSTAISYNFAGELKSIINDYANSTITDAEVQSKLAELKAKLPEDFLKSDETERNAEIFENQRAQEVLEIKIAELTNKISNEDNYKVSPAQYAKIRAKLSTCKANMSSYDSQIAMLNSQIPKNEMDLNEYKELIDICNEENEEIARQIIFNNGDDNELETELLAKQKMNFTIIAEANELIENVNMDGLENTQVLIQLEERKGRTEKLVASYQTELADENSIDKSEMRLDQIELANSQQGINALINREEFLNNSIAVVMDKIINKDLTMNNGVDINDNSNDQLPFAASAGVNPEDMTVYDNQELSPIPVGEVAYDNENDFSDIKPEGFGLNDEDLNLFNVEKPISIENRDGKIKEVSTSEVNEKLRLKSKLDSFRSVWNKHWKGVLFAAAIIAALAFGLTSCNQHNLEKATDSITNDDDAMDNIMDSEDPNQSLQDYLNDNGLTIEDDQNKKDDTNIESKDSNIETTNPVSGNKTDNSELNAEDKQESTEKAADPVDPSTIVDEHPEVKNTHAEPVDPSTIVDQNPDTGYVIPPTTPNQGTVIENSGVTGNETVSDNAWDNETPISTDSPVIGDNGGVSGNETISDDAWDNETPVVDDTSDEITNPEPNTNNQTVTIAVNAGDALIITEDGKNYVSDNGSNYVGQETDQDIFANDNVKSVSVVTDESGVDTINVEISSSQAVRDVALTDADVAAISEANSINKDEIAEIEAQYKAQQAALEELKQQVKSADETVVEQTIENTK